MNLNSYDNVADTLNKSKTWVDVKKKILLSREIKYRPYVTLIKRYNPNSQITDYFVALTNTPPENKDYKSTRRDDYGRIKINIKSIWYDTYLPQLDKDCNIVINLVESDDDGDIYQLDI